MKVLITGAKGQLGTAIRISREAPENATYIDLDELDLADAEAVDQYIKTLQPNVIVNCAAYTNVDAAEDDYATADAANRQGPCNLANAALAVGATLIHISTDYVFPGDASEPYTEESPTRPLSVYGATKLAGEQAIVASGCRYIIIRTAWLYSPFGRNFVKTMMKLTHDKQSLKVVADQKGSPTCALDLADAICHIIRHDMLDRQGIYHYSNQGTCTWHEFATEICREAGNKCDIAPCTTEEYPTRAHRPHYSVMSTEKIRSTFGIDIPQWRDSLHACIVILKQQQ